MGCWSSEGGKSDRSVVVAWSVKERFLRERSSDLECLSSCVVDVGSRPRKLQRSSLRQPRGFALVRVLLPHL